MDGGSDQNYSRRSRRKKYCKAKKRGRGFCSAKSRLKMQREVLKSTVERMTQQKDEYKTRTEDLYRFDYACVTPFFMDCDAGIEWVVLFIIYCNLLLMLCISV